MGMPSFNSVMRETGSTMEDYNRVIGEVLHSSEEGKSLIDRMAQDTQWVGEGANSRSTDFNHTVEQNNREANHVIDSALSGAASMVLGVLALEFACVGGLVTVAAMIFAPAYVNTVIGATACAVTPVALLALYRAVCG